jgi:LPS export ABC transporter protein LptC
MNLRHRPEKWGLIFCICFLGCNHNNQINDHKDDQTVLLPNQEMWHWSTVVTRGGKKRAYVRADHFIRIDQPEQTIFDGQVQVVFFDNDGDTVSLLNALRGQIDADGSQMAVAGQVVVMARDSTRLETDSLRWNREQNRIFGDGEVLLSRPDGMETGVGFEATSDLKRWTLKQVQTRVTSP